MDLLPSEQFFAWAAERGIELDPRYPRADALTLLDAGDHWRPWPLPRAPREVLPFLETLLEAAAPGSAWLVYPRPGGHWYGGSGNVPINNDLIDTVTRGVGIPAGFQGAVRFGSDERAPLLALLVASLLFGWGTGEDLFAMPEDGSCLLLTDHHDQVIGEFATAERLATVERTMAAAGYDPQGTDLAPPT